MYQEIKGEPFSEANTENKTKFHFNDAISEQQESYLGDAPWELRNQWRRFHGYQTGIWNWGWADKTKLFKQDKDNLIGAIVGQLGLTDRQKRAVRDICRQLRFENYSPFYDSIHIIFCICVLVANVDYQGKGWIYYPTKGDYDQPRGKAHVEDGHKVFVKVYKDLSLNFKVIEKGLPKFKYIVENLPYPTPLYKSGSIVTGERNNKESNNQIPISDPDQVQQTTDMTPTTWEDVFGPDDLDEPDPSETVSAPIDRFR